MQNKSLLLIPVILSSYIYASPKTHIQETIKRSLTKTKGLIACSSNFIDNLNSKKVVSGAGFIIGKTVFNVTCLHAYSRLTLPGANNAPLIEGLAHDFKVIKHLNTPLTVVVGVFFGIKGINRFARYLLNVKNKKQHCAQTKTA